jgi:hypothetical protein
MLEIQHGDVTLRELPDYPGYAAGNDGFIYSLKRRGVRRLKPVLNKRYNVYYVTVYNEHIRYARRTGNGRVVSCMRPDPRSVHSLVAAVWLPPRPSRIHEVDHIDGSRANNRPDNLRWLTKAENNNAFLVRSGRRPRLPGRVALAVRGAMGVLPVEAVMAKWDVSRRQVRAIWRGASYAT